jgi:hypothetical protein
MLQQQWQYFLSEFKRVALVKSKIDKNCSGFKASQASPRTIRYSNYLSFKPNTPRMDATKVFGIQTT